jgi:hypothetical protein
MTILFATAGATDEVRDRGQGRLSGAMGGSARVVAAIGESREGPGIPKVQCLFGHLRDSFD